MSFGEFSTFVFCQERGGRLAKWGPEGAFRGHQHHFQFSTNSKGHQPAPASKVGAPGPKWRHCPTQRPTLATYFSLALCNNCSFCPGEQIGILSQLPASPILRSGYELFWVTVPDEGQPGGRVVHPGWWLIIGDYCIFTILFLLLFIILDIMVIRSTAGWSIEGGGSLSVITPSTHQASQGRR